MNWKKPQMTPYDQFKRLMNRDLEHHRIAQAVEDNTWYLLEPYMLISIPYRTVLQGEETAGEYLRAAWTVCAGATVILHTGLNRNIVARVIY